MSIQLFEHNERAYQAVRTMLADHGRAAVVHPTGTGKSYIAFRLVEENAEKRFLWLSPSEYIFQTQIENLCAENPTFPVDSINFATYAKLMLLEGEALDNLAPDFIVLDEFHRCGADQWGKGVDRLLSRYPEAKVLGLSATAIRYLDNNRNMAEELFQGCIASEMTLGEAIVRGILPAPVYVSTLFRYQNELQRYQNRIDSMRSGGVRDNNQKYLDALRRALEKADGLDTIFQRYLTHKNGKYIVFCANVEHMREMVSHVPEWFGGIDPEPKVYAVFSDSAESGKEFEEFKADSSDHLKLLFCIDMLNEGVHVAGISGVILFRPTVSPIIYKQQIGRALTAGVGGTPLIIDVVNNLESIRSIDSLQDEMSKAVLWLRANGRGGEIVHECFEILEQQRDCRELFEELERSLSSTWEQYFQAAWVYSREHEGSLGSLPARYVTENGLSLGNWVQTQKKIRTGRQQGSLTDEQIARLNAIGMVWENRLELQFQRNYKYAKAYFEQYGDLLVPAAYQTEDGFRLGAWICKLRQQYVNGEQAGVLSQERVRQLNAIGMCWDVLSYNWEKNYSEALDYSREHGDLNVPAGHRTKSGFALGNWLNNLRSARAGKNRQTPPTAEQVERLNAIGMRWGNRFDEQWQNSYQEAKRYFEKNSTLSNIPPDYRTPDGVQLSRWVNTQQYALDHPEKSSSRLTKERTELLRELGLHPSEKKDPWMRALALAERYRDAFGTLNISQSVSFEGFGLGRWLALQRKSHQKGQLSDEQIRRLELLSFDWRTTSERQWEERFAEAEAYRKERGNLGVPASSRGLGRWLQMQRDRRRKGLLTEVQISRLDALGMDWGRMAAPVRVEASSGRPSDQDSGQSFLRL